MDAQIHTESPQVLSRRRALGWAGATGAAALLAACGSRNATTSASAPAAATPAAGGAAAPPLAVAATPGESWLYLTIVTGGMIGKKGWPEYVPGDFSVPAGSTVHVEIRCFDDGPASIPGGYEKVKGTVDGSMTVLSAVDGDVAQAKSQTVTSIDPKNVAHTLTIADTGLNIPVPPLGTVRFTFKTGPAGAHGWQCMAACGTGQGGWAGPMATGGYMNGTMTVV